MVTPCVSIWQLSPSRSGRSLRTLYPSLIEWLPSDQHSAVILSTGRGSLASLYPWQPLSLGAAARWD